MPIVSDKLKSNPSTPIEIKKMKTKYFWMEPIIRRLVGEIREGRISFVFPDGWQVICEGKSRYPQATVKFHSAKALKRLLSGGYIGLAEGYIQGDWSTPSLANLFEFGTANETTLDKSLTGSKLIQRINNLFHSFRKNSRNGSKRNIAEHYDLGNDFFANWLEPSLTYSSGIFKEKGSLDLKKAQIDKYRRIIQTLDIQSKHNVLEIGCGWGGFAEFVARETGANVTALTISKKQFQYANKSITKKQLTNNIQINLQDYRDHSGNYDRIVSIEMLEAVGEKYWPDYFQTLSKCLSKDGQALIQVITIPDDKFESYRLTVDFIQRYIFPGGLLISPAKLRENCELVNLKLVESYMFGASYAQTLEIWRKNFLEGWSDIKKLGFDEKFKKMWEYYLTYTAAGFKAHCTDVGQFHITK